MIDALGGALAGKLVILAQEGRKLQCLQVMGQQNLRRVGHASAGTLAIRRARDNIIAVGNSGTGKSHIALGLGLAACQKGLSVGFTKAAALVHELLEARDEKRLLRLQRQLAGYKCPSSEHLRQMAG
jgi:DNA replication protein DnaC